MIHCIQICLVFCVIDFYFYRKVTSYAVSKGPNFTLNVSKPVTELTAEMIQRLVVRMNYIKLFCGVLKLGNFSVFFISAYWVTE